MLRLLGSLRRWWPLLCIAVVLALGWEELRSIDLHAVRDSLKSLAPGWLLAAFAVTLVNIALLGVYDLITLRGTSVPPLARWGFGSLAFVWSNFLTLGPIAGPAIRFWLYRPYGLEAGALRAAIVATMIAFSAGLGACLLAAWFLPPLWGMLAAAVLLALLAVGLGRLGRLERLPSWLRRDRASWSWLFLVALFDWVLAAAAFGSAMRATGQPIPASVVGRVFFQGQAIGALSLLPGGLGSADAFWILRLPIDSAVASAGLVAYRAIYYLLPWLFACLVLLWLGGRSGARWLNPVPTVLGLLVAGGGVVLLVSTASPALEHRMQALQRWVPIGLVEASHLVGVLAGLVLLLLARGVMRGYRDAHRLTIIVLVGGAVAAALKGLDYEEAFVLLALAAVALSQEARFTRRGRAPWVFWTALLLVALAFVTFAIIGFGSHTPGPQMARFLRSLSLLGLSAVAFLLYVGLRVPTAFRPPAPAEIDRAIGVHAAVGSGTSPMMVASGDKSIFFFGEQAFCSYRVIGAYLVVFSDPTVPAGEERAFVEALMAHADGLDRRVVFYQVGAFWLPILHDYGFSFFKLGEEAILSLAGFSLSGGRWKTLRHTARRIEEDESYSFAILTPEQTAARLEELRRVSDEWLQSVAGREKQFSVGAFSAEYLRRFPCAVVQDAHGRIVAFASLLCGPRGEELSIDLMRHGRAAPDGVMDYLFVRLMEWGSAQGFARFNLGMAPLASVGEASRARVWERLAALLFRHGEGLYHFQGLRAYKAKFHPEWTPRYMGYPQAWEWPFAAAQVAVLIAGGWRSVLGSGRGAA